MKLGLIVDLKGLEILPVEVVAINLGKRQSDQPNLQGRLPYICSNLISYEQSRNYLH